MKGDKKYVMTTSFYPRDGGRQITMPEGCTAVLYVFEDRERAVEVNASDDLVYLTEAQKGLVSFAVDPETGEILQDGGTP